MVHECDKGGRDGIQSWPINFKGGEYTNAQPWSMNVQEGEQAGVKPWSIKCKRVVEPVSSYYPPLGSTCQKEPLHFVCFIQHFAWKLVLVLNWPYQGHGGFGEGLQRLKKKKKMYLNPKPESLWIAAYQALDVVIYIEEVDVTLGQDYEAPSPSSHLQHRKEVFHSPR